MKQTEIKLFILRLFILSILVINKIYKKAEGKGKTFLHGVSLSVLQHRKYSNDYTNMTSSGFSIFFLLLSFRILAQEPEPPNAGMAGLPKSDWLVEPTNQPAEVLVIGKDIVLQN